LIQELLDAASLQAGRKLQLDRRQTDLVALATRVVADYRARTVFHLLELSVTAGPLVGDWDPQRLARVLDNLVGNAVKYSRRGPINLALGREHEWAVIKVHDHGVGIPAAELEHVFDRFYRGSNVARDIRGVGIGLSGVRQIVEQHGGSVCVESQEGVGSTFTVRLPLGCAA
jgi:signal transduction histidine kinase